MVLLCCLSTSSFSFFFFNDTATTEIYTLSLHDALPIFGRDGRRAVRAAHARRRRHPAELRLPQAGAGDHPARRSEEHTSELQSQSNLVCRLLLEKKKNRCDILELVGSFGSGDIVPETSS